MKQLMIIASLAAALTLVLLITPVQASAYSVDVRATRGFSATELLKLRSAISLVERVVESPEFRARVLEFHAPGRSDFVQNNGLTNKEIYDRILSRPLELDVTLYTASIWKRLSFSDSTVGYTTPNTTRTWINRKFFSRFTPANVAANLMHEWMHKIGFDHDFNRTARRPYSVPYAVGRIVGQLAESMDKTDDITQVPLIVD